MNLFVIVRNSGAVYEVRGMRNPDGDVVGSYRVMRAMNSMACDVDWNVFGGQGLFPAHDCVEIIDLGKIVLTYSEGQGKVTP